MFSKEKNLSEANRCLLCKNARCNKACPIGTDIPHIIKLYKEGNKGMAKEILFENNPFSSVCSIVCDWYRQCAGDCIRGIKGNPIEFYKIEQELSVDYLLNEVKFNTPVSNGKRVAIVGGGPAGITGALILGKKGYEVTIYEAEERIGGVLRYGIPSFRLEKNIVDRYEELLKELNVKIINRTLIGKDILLKDLINEYDAVFIGSGTGKAKNMGIKGEDKPFVHYAVDYLKNPESYDLGDKVLVIGGGNVAIDACRTAHRLGYDTTVYYRKTFENMPANKIEIEDARKEGVKFEVFKAPAEVVDNGMMFADAENITDEKGRVVTKVIEGSEKFVECSSVIVAVSQTTFTEIFDETGINLSPWGTVVTDENDMTNIDGVFSCGDVVSGAQTVVLAVNNAKRTALNIDKYIMGEENE